MRPRLRVVRDLLPRGDIAWPVIPDDDVPVDTSWHATPCRECGKRKSDVGFWLCLPCARLHYPPEPEGWTNGDSSAVILQRIRSTREPAV